MNPLVGNQDPRSRGLPKTAVVAYVSSDAIVPFGAGDTLVTDATDEAIGSGQTRARVLRDALARGAEIYSCPNLHAKVILLPQCGVAQADGGVNPDVFQKQRQHGKPLLVRPEHPTVDQVDLLLAEYPVLLLGLGTAPPGPCRWMSNSMLVPRSRDRITRMIGRLSGTVNPAKNGAFVASTC
jgi:hypothetical protein